MIAGRSKAENHPRSKQNRQSRTHFSQDEAAHASNKPTAEVSLYYPRCFSSNMNHGELGWERIVRSCRQMCIIVRMWTVLSTSAWWIMIYLDIASKARKCLKIVRYRVISQNSGTSTTLACFISDRRHSVAQHSRVGTLFHVSWTHSELIGGNWNTHK